MSDFLQQFGSLGTTILKILVVIIILRILIFALGYKIVDYIPVIDDIINLMYNALTFMAKAGENLLGKVVHM
jgi:hypothetical protein